MGVGVHCGGAQKHMDVLDIRRSWNGANMSLQRFLASLAIAMPAAAILRTKEPAEQSICSSPSMASDSARSPAHVRAVGSPDVAPTAIDQTPDSEKVRRCLLREAEDKARVDVREAIEIQPDKHLGVE